MEKYKIRVAKDYLNFSAAHFVVEGAKCERLHGHNYGVTIEIEGTLDEIGYVVDFTKVKKIARNVCDVLDHRLLLPGQNPNLETREEEGETFVTLGSKSFVFPADDVLTLPVPNITAEYLAYHVGGEIRPELKSLDTVEALTTVVSEASGQEASHTRILK